MAGDARKNGLVATATNEGVINWSSSYEISNIEAVRYKGIILMHDNRRMLSENEPDKIAALFEHERIEPDDVLGLVGGRFRDDRNSKMLNEVSAQIGLFNRYVDQFHNGIDRINRLDEQHPFHEGQLTYRYTTAESKEAMIRRFADQAKSRFGDISFVAHQLNEFWGNRNFSEHTATEILSPLVKETAFLFLDQMLGTHPSNISQDRNWQPRRDSAKAVVAMGTHGDINLAAGGQRDLNLAALARFYLENRGFKTHLGLERDMQDAEYASLENKIESMKEQGPIDITELGRQIENAQRNNSIHRRDIESIDVQLYVMNCQIAERYRTAVKDRSSQSSRGI